MNLYEDDEVTVTLGPTPVWQPTGRFGPHAGEEIVQQVRNTATGQFGFRRPGSRVVYTWEQR